MTLVYAAVFIDAIHVKVRDGQVANRPVYAAIGVTIDGHKDVLGLWMGTGGEDAKFWMSVLIDLKNRGVADVFFLVCDGLKGLPDAVTNVWPQTIVQTCIIHLIRNTFRLVARQDWNAVKRDGRMCGLASALSKIHPVMRRAGEGQRVRWFSDDLPWVVPEPVLGEAIEAYDQRVAGDRGGLGAGTSQPTFHPFFRELATPRPRCIVASSNQGASSLAACPWTRPSRSSRRRTQARCPPRSDSRDSSCCYERCLALPTTVTSASAAPFPPSATRSCCAADTCASDTDGGPAAAAGLVPDAPPHAVVRQTTAASQGRNRVWKLREDSSMTRT